MHEHIDLLMIYGIGITFLVSGVVKLNDPLGFAYKIEDYLHLLTSQLTTYIRFLLPYTLVLAISIATLEVVLGVAIIARWQYLWTLRSLLVLTSFFTCLTLYTAVSKRMDSCGCFGDAMKLTPWQSFTKSGILLLMLGRLYWKAKNTPTSLNTYYWVGIALLFSLGLSRYARKHLPLLDFSPYKVGSDWRKKTRYARQFDTFLCNGQRDPAIMQALCSGNKLLIIVQHPAAITAAAIQKLYTLMQQLPKTLQPIVITPNGQSTEIATTLATPHYTADPLLLRDMLRAPWGLLHLQEGVVANKWHLNDLHSAKRVLQKRRA
ncbi:MAG: MauE/DoxX family redox-associated membrane protein [Bacteroidota bacterium]